MVMFKGKLPGKKANETKIEKEIPLLEKASIQIPVAQVKEENTKPSINASRTPSFVVPPVKSEEEKLRARVKELELKLQILEHTSEGYSKNDREYIRKLEDIIKTEKAVSKAIMLQNVDLRMLCGKYAEHLPKIDVTEDNWQSKLKG